MTFPFPDVSTVFKRICRWSWVKCWLTTGVEWWSRQHHVWGALKTSYSSSKVLRSSLSWKTVVSNLKSSESETVKPRAKAQNAGGNFTSPRKLIWLRENSNYAKSSPKKPFFGTVLIVHFFNEFAVDISSNINWKIESIRKKKNVLNINWIFKEKFWKEMPYIL